MGQAPCANWDCAGCCWHHTLVLPNLDVLYSRLDLVLTWTGKHGRQSADMRAIFVRHPCTDAPSHSWRLWDQPPYFDNHREKGKSWMLRSSGQLPPAKLINLAYKSGPKKWLDLSLQRKNDSLGNHIGCKVVYLYKTMLSNHWRIMLNFAVGPVQSEKTMFANCDVPYFLDSEFSTYHAWEWQMLCELLKHQKGFSQWSL